MNKQYTEKDIQALSDREHVRLRLPVYAGSTAWQEYTIPIFTKDALDFQTVSFIPAVYKCVNEIIDNSIDELKQVSNTDKYLKIEANALLGTYTISDNGRGIPIKKHESGKPTPEVVFGSLRSGRNFTEDKEIGVIGMNGMGASVTCMVSSEFHVDIHRDKKRYRQTFTNGGLNITSPSIRRTGSDKTGTSVDFQLDNTIFADTSLPKTLMENRAIEIALTNPGLTVEYNKKKFKFNRGFDDIVKQISNDYFKFASDGIEFYAIFDVHEGVDERVFSWVNSSLLFDGGLCNTQFTNAFYDQVVRHLAPSAKKLKCDVTKNDVRRNLLVLGNLRLSGPEYDAQSKTRLTGPNLRKDMAIMVTQMWPSFVRKNKDWLDTVLQRAAVRYHSIANKRAIEDHKKSLRKKVPGLLDATGSNRFECQLLVTEGDSAASMISQVRNPKTTASLPLRGKINNIHGCTIAQLLKMAKITDLITAIGLVPGQRALRSDLRYGKVVLTTDADTDGGDIFTLLVNLFYGFWPELFDPDYDPFIYRLIAPNVCAIKGDKRVHFPTRIEYDKKKEKYSGYKIKYYKGLGSMARADWDLILSGKTNTMIPIIDDGHLKDTLRLLFGPDTDARKMWLRQ